MGQGADCGRDPRVIAFAQRQVTLTDWIFTAGGVVLILSGAVLPLANIVIMVVKPGRKVIHTIAPSPACGRGRGPTLGPRSSRAKRWEGEGCLQKRTHTKRLAR